MSRNCSVVVVFSFWGKCPDRHAFCGRVGSAAQNLSRAIAHSGKARDAHPLLSEMDSRRARADRSDHGFDRPEIYRQRKDAAMAARSARRLYFSRRSSGGRERSHRESRLCFTRVVRARIQRRDGRDGKVVYRQLEHAVALSRRLRFRSNSRTARACGCPRDGSSARRCMFPIRWAATFILRPFR